MYPIVLDSPEPTAENLLQNFPKPGGPKTTTLDTSAIAVT